MTSDFEGSRIKGEVTLVIGPFVEELEDITEGLFEKS
jgi:hypothetical protein